jgi:hypothetical protein
MTIFAREAAARRFASIAEYVLFNHSQKRPRSSRSSSACCASARTAPASTTTVTKIDGSADFFIAHLVVSVIYHGVGNKEQVIYGERRQGFVE